MKKKALSSNWEVLKQFLPAGWEAKGKELGALKRRKKIKTLSDLLRLLLIHLADGYSMRLTKKIAKEGGITDISDVALLKRLRASSDWLRWMSTELLKRRGALIEAPFWLSGYNVKNIDATVITEPGSTGSDWRLHYSFNLFGLQCDQFSLTKPDVGESFVNFKVEKGDLLIGDRAYGRLKGLKHVMDNGGDFMARLKNKSFKMYDINGKEIKLLELLKPLCIGEVANHYVQGILEDGSSMQMRLCAIKKSDEDAKKSMDKALREAKKKQRIIDDETIKLHGYIILITSLPVEIMPEQVMELYRLRWQIEIAFKRLKSIMGLGHLPKTDIESSRAWLHGKIFVAILAQVILFEGIFFSPWGYPLTKLS